MFVYKSQLPVPVSVVPCESGKGTGKTATLSLAEKPSCPPLFSQLKYLLTTTPLRLPPTPDWFIGYFGVFLELNRRWCHARK